MSPTSPIIITGSTGFLGSAILALGHRWSEAQFLACPRLPLPETEQFLSAYPGASIIHTAALSSGPECERNPDQARESNVTLTGRVAAIAAAQGSHLTYVSTDLVFDGITEIPTGGLRDTDAPSPVSVYGQTKLEGEHAVLGASFSFCVVRASILIGPPYGEKKGVMGWMLDKLQRSETIDLFYDEWRTPIHLEDAVRGLVGITGRKLSGIWNLGGPERMSRLELGTLIARHYGLDPAKCRSSSRLSIDQSPPRPADVSLDSRSTWQELAYTPRPLRHYFPPSGSSLEHPEVP